MLTGTRERETQRLTVGEGYQRLIGKTFDAGAQMDLANPVPGQAPQLGVAVLGAAPLSPTLRYVVAEESPGKLDPFVMGKIANLHVETAQGYTDVGLLSEAMHELRKALLLCPHFADVRVKLANLYKQQGDPAAAIHELKEALKHREGYVPAHVALGVVQLGLGDLAAARASWVRAAELDPDNKAAQMYVRMLDTQQRG